MRFSYTPYSGNWLPLVPVVFAHGKKRLPPVKALVDTGATHTILPLEFATELGMHVDLTDRIETQIAGGSRCYMYPSTVPVDCVMRDPVTAAECRWTSPVFFVLDQEFVLLGHHQCLEKFDITFKGPEKVTEVIPRFRTESIGRPKRRR